MVGSKSPSRPDKQVNLDCTTSASHADPPLRSKAALNPSRPSLDSLVTTSRVYHERLAECRIRGSRRPCPSNPGLSRAARDINTSSQSIASQTRSRFPLARYQRDCWRKNRSSHLDRLAGAAWRSKAQSRCVTSNEFGFYPLSSAVAIVVDILDWSWPDRPPTKRPILRSKALTCDEVYLFTSLTLVTDITVQDSHHSSFHPPLPP